MCCSAMAVGARTARLTRRHRSAMPKLNESKWAIEINSKSESAFFLTALLSPLRKSLGGIEREARSNTRERITSNEARTGYSSGDGLAHGRHPGGAAGEKHGRHRVRCQTGHPQDIVDARSYTLEAVSDGCLELCSGDL